MHVPATTVGTGSRVSDVLIAGQAGSNQVLGIITELLALGVVHAVGPVYADTLYL